MLKIVPIFSMASPINKTLNSIHGKSIAMTADHFKIHNQLARQTLFGVFDRKEGFY